VSLGLGFFVPVPDSFAYVTAGSGLENSALVDLKYSEDVLESRILEGTYTQVTRVDTNARWAPIVDPTNPTGYQAPGISRAQAENLTPAAVRRQIEGDISDEAVAASLKEFVAEVETVPSRAPLSRWRLGTPSKVSSQWISFTPKICRITPKGRLTARKAGVCSLGVSFEAGDSGEFRMGKQIRFLA